MTDRARKAKNYLEGISDLKRKAAIAHDLAEELRESGISRPQQYGLRIQTSKGDPMLDRVSKIMEAEQAAIEQSVKFAERAAEISKLILAMDDSRYSELLFRKFVSGEPFEKIAEAMGYSVQRVFQLYPQALDSFADTLFL